MKDAVIDFLDIQMGINKDTLSRQPISFSDDGKIFDMLHCLIKYLSMHPDDFDLLRCLFPILDLWHTKWTDFSYIIRASWDKVNKDNLSTLSCFANVVELFLPSDLQKVNFYEGS